MIRKLVLIICLFYIYINNSHAQLSEIGYDFSLNYYRGEYKIKYAYVGLSHQLGYRYSGRNSSVGIQFNAGALSAETKNIMNELPKGSKFKSSYIGVDAGLELNVIKFHPALLASSISPYISFNFGMNQTKVTDNISIILSNHLVNEKQNIIYLTPGFGFKFAAGRYIIRSGFKYYFFKNPYIDGVNTLKKKDGLTQPYIGISYVFASKSSGVCVDKRLKGNFIRWGDKF